MALYAIGDLHLSLTANKSMEVFGPAWEHYVDRIGESLSQLSAQDVLVLAGDTSWGIDLAEAEADFRFLEQFPCKKLLVKGNHDYWWSTVSKMKAFFQDKGFANLDFLHNNCHVYGDYACLLYTSVPDRFCTWVFSPAAWPIRCRSWPRRIPTPPWCLCF